MPTLLALLATALVTEWDLPGSENIYVKHQAALPVAQREAFIARSLTAQQQYSYNLYWSDASHLLNYIRDYLLCPPRNELQRFRMQAIEHGYRHARPPISQIEVELRYLYPLFGNNGVFQRKRFIRQLADWQIYSAVSRWLAENPPRDYAASRVNWQRRV